MSLDHPLKREEGVTITETTSADQVKVLFLPFRNSGPISIRLDLQCNVTASFKSLLIFHVDHIPLFPAKKVNQISAE